jgi:hypothetical protein
VRAATIPATELTVPVPAAHAVVGGPETTGAATAVRVRARDVRRFGKRHSKTADRDCASRGRTRHSSRGDRSKKIRISRLGDGPRNPRSDTGPRHRASWRLSFPGREGAGNARRSDYDTAAIGPGGSRDRGSFVGNAAPRVFVATGGRRPGIPGCNTAFADGLAERAFHTLSGDTFAGEAEKPLDRPESCGKLEVGPRKL